MALGRRRAIGEAGWGWTAFAGVISFIYFFPVLWIILTAFKTHNDALAIPPKWLFTPTLQNFVQVFSRAYSVVAAQRIAGEGVGRERADDERQEHARAGDEDRVEEEEIEPGIDRRRIDAIGPREDLDEVL